MVSQIRGVRIAGVASTVPAGVRTIEDEANVLGVDPVRLKRLQRDIGISRRHVTLNGECTSDLCEQAASSLLSELTYDPGTIDALLLVTQTPDYFQPATSYILHGRLGLNRDCAVYDLNLGCSGYVYGL